MRLHLTGDATHEVELDEDGVHVDGEPLIVRTEEDGRLTVMTSGGEIAAVAAVRGDVAWVGIEGHVFELKASRKAVARRATTADADALSAPMPATVVRILVQPGARVAGGDMLIALEAMKMELAIRAPHDGVVRSINCREGDLVQPGTPLADM